MEKAIWGDLLDYRKITTVGLQSLSRIVSHHGKGGNSCPCCDKIPDQRTSILAISGAFSLHRDVLFPVDMYTSIPTLWCRKLDIDSGIGGVSKAYSMLA